MVLYMIHYSKQGTILQDLVTTTMTTLTDRLTDRPGFRPLYQQVRELLLDRIANGVWRPAEALPSEQTLAAELGVSQGTVRKALDSLASDSLVERRQGRGTYVAEHTQESAQFRFFKVSYADGRRTLPTCPKASITRRAAKVGERSILSLPEGAEIYQIKRDRLIDDTPAVRELIVAPADLFPDLGDHAPLPNAIYTLYQSAYGVSIVSAGERIRAIAATRDDASVLNVDPGSPLLQIERTAFDIAGRAIELRQSRFVTDNYMYAVELR